MFDIIENWYTASGMGHSSTTNVLKGYPRLTFDFFIQRSTLVPLIYFCMGRCIHGALLRNY